MPAGMRVGQEEGRAVYVLAIDGQRPHFGERDINYKFARTADEAAHGPEERGGPTTPAGGAEGEAKERVLALQGERDLKPAGIPGAEWPRPGESRAFDGMEFVWIPAGEFLMGSTSWGPNHHERTVTRVRISRGFWLGKYEVMQSEWQAVVGTNPSEFSGCGRCPAERVWWDDTQEFIGRLNARTGGVRYRLPTEAEWEYAARAGTSGDRYAASVDAIAWHSENSGRRTHPVGQKAPNLWGLHDMLGNVSEWVQDWFGDYLGGYVTDPQGPGSGSTRVSRGGSWYGGARPCRTTFRFKVPTGLRGFYLGFRLLRTAPSRGAP